MCFLSILGPEFSMVGAAIAFLLFLKHKKKQFFLNHLSSKTFFFSFDTFLQILENSVLNRVQEKTFTGRERPI